jgi:hypothetical protein
MLETVLAIGKAFRESTTLLKHHRYIRQCPQDNEKNMVLRLSLPVDKNFRFDLDGIKEITDENVIKDGLFYLTFKTADADSLVKYIFGDIYYSLEKGKDGGYYKLADQANKQRAYQVGSFLRGDKDSQDLTRIFEQELQNGKADFAVSSFRDEFRRHLVLIERMLKYQCGIWEYLDLKRQGESTTFKELLSEEDKLRQLTAKKVFSAIKSARGAKGTFKKILGIEDPQWGDIESNRDRLERLISYSTGSLFLHFHFNGKHWYEFKKEFDIINAKMLDDFAEKSVKPDGYLLKKYIYKTLSSPEKDRQFPYFQAQSRYRNKIFRNIGEIADLLYAIDYSKNALVKIPYTGIKIIVLPRGKNLMASHYETFSRSETALTDEQEREAIIGQENMQNTRERLFAPLIDNVSDNIIQYDLIFSKRGGQTSPDVDMVEISGVEKSHLRDIDRRIRRIKENLYNKRKNEMKAEKPFKPFSITRSFLNILKDATSEVKKYQSHLYKVLPQIYTAAYYDDPILLPALIQKEEANIRASNSDFSFLKYDFYFLTTIQNSIPEGGNLMTIQNSQSYKIGKLLGELARQFANWREDCPIKSFEKSYVGTLSRRITTIPDLVKFKTFIEEKLILHERTRFTFAVSTRLSEEIRTLESSTGERYDRHNCAFGFFESYFSR